MPEQARRGLGSIGVVVSLAMGITSIPVIRFYQMNWARLTALPALVKHEEFHHGGRWTPLKDVSPWLPKALVATEDRTFYSNLGISFEGIGRALLVDLRTHKLAQGGSTLTQQLVRRTMLSPVKKFRRKVSEALLAVMMTALYPKGRILSLYLNDVYLGGGAYGIEAASERYFGVAPRFLTLPEASLIAGLPQAPSAYDPQVHLEAAKARQWQVLESMVADNMLTQRMARAAYRAPLPLLSAGRRG